MSAKDVDEVIDHILAEVNLFVPHYDRKMDRYIRQQHDKDPVSGFVRLVTRPGTERSRRTSLLVFSKLAGGTSTMMS